MKNEAIAIGIGAILTKSVLAVVLGVLLNAYLLNRVASANNNAVVANFIPDMVMLINLEIEYS